MKLSDIKKNPNNPRLVKDDKFRKLCKSIEEFPQMMELRPIVVDADGVILGGNMRYEAIKANGMREVPDAWVKRADELTEEQKREFVVKDNVGFGEWDWDVLANEWDDLPLDDWGLDVPDADIGMDEAEAVDGFSLKDGDREPFQNMSFTFADEQAERVKAAIAEMKASDEYKYAETFGNENGNGNALYLIVASWAGQRI